MNIIFFVYRADDRADRMTAVHCIGRDGIYSGERRMDMSYGMRCTHEDEPDKSG